MDSKKRWHSLFLQWKQEFLKHKKLVLISLGFLILSAIVDFFAGSYVTHAGQSLAFDLILDSFDPIDLNFIFVYFWLFVIFLFFAYPLFLRVNILHKAISQFSLLLFLRSFFMIFTHLKTPLDAIPVKFPWIFHGLYFENDLFFSGHTAIPFLGFFIFRDSKIKYFFLASSIILGATTLLMHRHYTIDVFSAFFIAYGSYRIGHKFFNWIESKKKI